MKDKISVAVTGRAARSGFVPVRGSAGKLYFLFDPERDLIQIGQKGRFETIDLAEYRRRVLTQKPGS
jgi:hypothetical protein